MSARMADSVPLGEARDWLRARVEAGDRCPCCSQFAKVYKRTINTASAKALIALWNAAGYEFAHLPTVVGKRRADEAKMTYWGLIEEEMRVRPDGGRAGFWRVTETGRSWLEGRITLPKYAHVYDGRCLRLDGPDWHISDAIKEPFDLRELMSA